MEPTSNEQTLREENEQLRERLREVRERLHEPEEIIRAIRGGEVDAVVVEDQTDPQVYALRQPDLLYRAVIEEMKEGALVLDAAGRVLYCNAYSAQLTKMERGTLLGSSFLPFVPPESRWFFDGTGKPSPRAT